MLCALKNNLQIAGLRLNERLTALALPPESGGVSDPSSEYIDARIPTLTSIALLFGQIRESKIRKRKRCDRASHSLRRKEAAYDQTTFLLTFEGSLSAAYQNSLVNLIRIARLAKLTVSLCFNHRLRLYEYTASATDHSRIGVAGLAGLEARVESSNIFVPKSAKFRRIAHDLNLALSQPSSS